MSGILQMYMHAQHHLACSHSTTQAKARMHACMQRHKRQPWHRFKASMHTWHVQISDKDSVALSFCSQLHSALRHGRHPLRSQSACSHPFASTQVHQPCEKQQVWCTYISAHACNVHAMASAVKHKMYSKTLSQWLSTVGRYHLQGRRRVYGRDGCQRLSRADQSSKEVAATGANVACVHSLPACLQVCRDNPPCTGSSLHMSHLMTPATSALDAIFCTSHFFGRSCHREVNGLFKDH